MKYTVSTVRLLAGGAPDEGWPFKLSDYADCSTWPFETMVFAGTSSIGLYHEAHTTEAEACDGHARILAMIEKGLEFPGETVEGPNGTPTLKPEQWRLRAKAKTTEAY
jgi:hypothetical protein